MQATLVQHDPTFGQTDVLTKHRSQCRACALRWERARQLDVIRRSEPPEQKSDRTSQISDGVIQYSGLLTPLGNIWIAVGSRGLVAVDSSADEPTFCYGLEATWTRPVNYAPDTLSAMTDQFQEYFEGRRTCFDLQFDLSRIPAFQRVVLEAVAQVPYAEVASYGEIARVIGMPSAARAVGTAVATNPLSIVIPCHRIVRSDGTSGEYALRSLGPCGRFYKLALLDLESHQRSE